MPTFCFLSVMPAFLCKKIKKCILILHNAFVFASNFFLEIDGVLGLKEMGN